MHRAADTRPRRRFLGDDRDVGVLGAEPAIELVEESDGLEVFAVPLGGS